MFSLLYNEPVISTGGTGPLQWSPPCFDDSPEQNNHCKEVTETLVSKAEGFPFVIYISGNEYKANYIIFNRGSAHTGRSELTQP